MESRVVLNVEIPAGLRKRVKVVAAVKGTTLTQVVTDALVAYLQEHEVRHA